MTFISTRDPDGRQYGLAEALRLGPAPDGGLFMPAHIERLPGSFFDTLTGRPMAEIAADVLEHLTPGELDRDTWLELATDALDFDIPLVKVRERLHVLEIFHGPTLAFKDVGARFLARLLALTQPEGRRATVLVATSGDTGGAVAQAFYGVEGVDVAILYPDGKVSPLQERQFTTLGKNVRAFAVDGVFDDCQRLVKEAFADRELSAQAGLTSANSINVGRLLPQAVYYFHAVAQLPEGAGPPLFSTPSGNFGNLTAGLLARALGLDARFIAATNVNDVVPVYLETGHFEPRASLRTLSNAMDVGHPNNFERILHLYGHDYDAISADVSGFRVDDAATRETIRRIESETGYLLDPHTAVGWLAIEELISDHFTAGIVLGTAHPAKFADLVEPILERPVELPERLACHLEKPVLSVKIEPELDALRDHLL